MDYDEAHGYGDYECSVCGTYYRADDAFDDDFDDDSEFL